MLDDGPQVTQMATMSDWEEREVAEIDEEVLTREFAAADEIERDSPEPSFCSSVAAVPFVRPSSIAIPFVLARLLSREFACTM